MILAQIRGHALVSVIPYTGCLQALLKLKPGQPYSKGNIRAHSMCFARQGHGLMIDLLRHIAVLVVTVKLLGFR